MLQLDNLPTHAEGRLCRAAVRRDGAAIAWDIDVAFDMHDETDAESVEPYVPGTVAIWCAGQEGGRGTVKVTGGFDLLHVAFARDGEQLAAGHAEVRACSVNVASEQSTLVVRLRVHGLLPRAAAALAYELDELLAVSMDTRQLALFNAPAEAPPLEAEPEIVGRLLVVPDGEDRVAGICTAADVDNLTIDTLEAGSLEIPRPTDQEARRLQLATVLEVVTPDGVKLDELLDSYRITSTELGAVPSWHYIVAAIGELYAEGQLQARPDFAWELSPNVVARALQLCAQGDSP